MHLDSLANQAVLGLTLTGHKNITQLFGPGLSPGAEIILPETSKWAADVRQRWSSYQAPTYTGAIKPATVSDIQHIVRYFTRTGELLFMNRIDANVSHRVQVKIAGANEVPFLTTGGGHGISDYTAFVGIAIDLSNFDSVYIDPENQFLTVGASTMYSQLYDVLYNAGKELRMFKYNPYFMNRPRSPPHQSLLYNTRQTF